MSDRLERLTNLVALLLDAKVPLTLENIASELGMYPSEPENRRASFERDKKLLRDEGVPITVVPMSHPIGTSGYIIRSEDFYLPQLNLTDSEEIALRLAMVNVPIGSGGTDSALLKLGGRFSAGQSAIYELPVSPLLPDVYEATKTRSSMAFLYTDRRGATARRTVNPYGAICRRGFWYLVGYCHDRLALRTFRIDRIGEGSLAIGEANSFERPPNFNVAHAITDDPKLLGNGDLTVTTVLIGAARAWLAEQELGRESVVERRSDGSVVVSVPVNHRPAFRAWLFGFGEHAEVLAPVEFRSEITEWLTKIAGRNVNHEVAR